MCWKPNVTVAAIVERDQKFLLVEENADKLIVFNQPAGHLEKDETLIGAVKREVLEETAWEFIPQCIVGIYLYPNQHSNITSPAESAPRPGSSSTRGRGSKGATPAGIRPMLRSR